MNLTGKQLVEQGIVVGPIEADNIQQHGVDLNLVSVSKIVGSGYIPKKGKTQLANREVIEPFPFYDEERDETIQLWLLQPGMYDITFAQGCNVPPNQRLEIYQRSSLLRNGAILRSSVFDAGFKTAAIGTVIHIGVPITIEVGARVAQMVAVASNVVENLYDGQWQNDKQRTSEGGSSGLLDYPRL